MEELVENLKKHLQLIKASKSDEADEQFYKLMVKAKEQLGDIAYPMAHFYFEYASFVLNRIESDLEILNANIVQNQQNQVPLEQIDESFDGSSSPQSLQQSVSQEEGQEKQNQFDGNDVKEKEQEQDQSQKNTELIDKDDREICFLNLQSALQIYTDELKKHQDNQFSQIQVNEILTGIARVKQKLGDLYTYNEDYAKAIDQYRDVVAQQEKREGADCNRELAGLHFVIGTTFLHLNTPGCENIALGEFFKAISILLNHMSLIENYGIEEFKQPTIEQPTVDRFAYLPKPFDSAKIVEIKEILGDLLNKVQDTHDQIGIRTQYEEFKKKAKNQQGNNGFKQVAADAPVIKLGIFGNRKKKITNDNEEQNDNTQRKETKEEGPQEDQKTAKG